MDPPISHVRCSHLYPVRGVRVVPLEVEDVPGLDLVVEEVVAAAEAGDDGRPTLLLADAEDLAAHARVQPGQVVRDRHVLLDAA